MLLKRTSRLLDLLLFLSSPSPFLPALLPLWIEHARVGTDNTSYVRVMLRRR